MIEGVKVMMGGKEWIVPALNFKQVRSIQGTLAQQQADPTFDTFGLTVEVVQLALSRNYPEITKDEVEELVDLRNAKELFRVVMGQSGMIEAAPGE